MQAEPCTAVEPFHLVPTVAHPGSHARGQTSLPEVSAVIKSDQYMIAHLLHVCKSANYGTFVMETCFIDPVIYGYSSRDSIICWFWLKIRLRARDFCKRIRKTHPNRLSYIETEGELSICWAIYLNV